MIALINKTQKFKKQEAKRPGRKLVKFQGDSISIIESEKH